ncbi:MAG: hypothetical protein KTR30_27190 [Saprospiraceae bacterium]|nr:hypothetical protein [Saprospiraceae bacterium]
MPRSQHLKTIRLSLISFSLLLLGWNFGYCDTAAKAPVEAVIIPGIYAMPEVNNSKTSAATSSSSSKEDMQKFLGYEILPVRYLSLPYDVFVKSNISSYFIDIGFLLLLFIPLLWVLKLDRNPIYNLINISLLLSFLIISVPSAYLSIKNLSISEGLMAISNQLSQSSFGEAPISHLNLWMHKIGLWLYQPIYELLSKVSGEQDVFTYPLLGILFVGAYLLLKRRVEDQKLPFKSLSVFMLSYFFFWLLLGAGGIWYGFLIACIPYLLMFKGITSSSDRYVFSRKIRVGTALAFSAMWIFMAFAYRAGNYALDLKENETPKRILIDPVIQYQTGNIDAAASMNLVFPQYNQAIQVLNSEQESLVYSVGTFLSYFVRKNDERVFSDTFLDFFPQLVDRFQDKTKIMQALKANGFRFIIVDLQLSNNDYTAEKSLTKKFVNLLNSLYGNPMLELVATDRILEVKGQSSRIHAVFQDQGEVVHFGRFALFRII